MFAPGVNFTMPMQCCFIAIAFRILSLLCPLEASVFYMHNICPPLVFLAIRQSNRWHAGGQPFWALEIHNLIVGVH